MADTAPKLPPMPEADDKMVAAMVREMFDCRRYSEPWDGVMRRCYAAAVKAAPPVSEAAQSIEQARELSDAEIELIAIKHAPPVAPGFEEDDSWLPFARAILAAARSTQPPKGAADV